MPRDIASTMNGEEVRGGIRARPLGAKSLTDTLFTPDNILRALGRL